MAWIKGRSFLMGSDDHYPEERPVHEVWVDGFWMDEHPVTVAEFRRFVRETGHVTVAERPLDAADYPEADPALLVPGGLVFQRSRGPVPLDNYHNWWAYIPGANWQHPEGPGSSVAGRDRHGMFVHPEPVDPDLVDRALLGVVVLRAHEERAPLDPGHVARRRAGGIDGRP